MIDTHLRIEQIPTRPGSAPFLSPERWDTDVHLPLSEVGYQVDEYAVSGSGAVYSPDPVDDDPRGNFTTRALVIRPKHGDDFSGVVHLELLNPSTGEDFPMFWPDAGFHLIERGDVYIGLTCKGISASSLREREPERYASLHIDHDSVIWDLLGSVAYLTHLPDAGGLLPGLGMPRRLFATGWSQSGSFLRTYLAEGIHAAHSVNLPGGHGREAIIDGYLIGVSSGGFGPMGYVELHRNGEIPFDMNLMPLTDNPDQIEINDPRRTIRNAPVPVIEYMSEDEATHNIWSLRPDSDTPTDLYRCFQVPGRGHETGLLAMSHRDREFHSYAEELPQVEDPPRHESSRWLIAATINHLVEWSEGIRPPRAERILFNVAETEAADPLGLNFDYVAAITDGFGHAIGGLRHLEVDIPTARWTFDPIGPKIVRSWKRQPLTRAELDAEYGDLSQYEQRVRVRARELVAEGWLLLRHVDPAVDAAVHRYQQHADIQECSDLLSLHSTAAILM